MGWLALAMSVSLAGPAAADAGGVCVASDDPATQMAVKQHHGRATVSIVSTPGRRNQVVRVEYNDETYVARFDNNGQANIDFALVSEENKLVVRGSEFGSVRCQIAYPDITKVYRAILRWHDPVRLNLHVVEPGRRIGGYGHINPDARNTQLDRGIGQIDVETESVESGATGEQSYVVDEAARPKEGGLYTFRFDYVTRGSHPAPQYCGTGAFANISLSLIILDHGQHLSLKNYDTGSIACGQSIPDDLRLQRLR